MLHEQKRIIHSADTRLGHPFLIISVHYSLILSSPYSLIILSAPFKAYVPKVHPCLHTAKKAGCSFGMRAIKGAEMAYEVHLVDVF